MQIVVIQEHIWAVVFTSFASATNFRRMVYRNIYSIIELLVFMKECIRQKMYKNHCIMAEMAV